MWRFRTRKSRASKNWHSKAMLVDFKKTRITMTNVNASLNLAGDMATASEISAASASFDSM